jgi:transposase-like protein
MKQQRLSAKKDIKAAYSVLKHMEKHVSSDNQMAIDLATAFFHVLGYHLEHGDLTPSNVRLAALLRRNEQ